MSSQGSGPGPNILEKLSEWSSEEIENNLDPVLQELMIHLGGEDKGIVLQSVYALLVTCLPCLPLERANKCLLQHAIPAAQLLFQESLEGIKLRLGDDSLTEDLENITDTVSSLLQVCNELLKCMECVLQYIVSHSKVSISSVPNVPKTVAVLMLLTFRHCKESETMYKGVFSEVAGILGSVFHQCRQLQSRFFSAVTDHISYDCLMKEDVDHLVDVLQILAEVGEHVMRLDVKTMAEQWKGYAKLVQLYLESLREHLNISYPIKCLSLEVKCNLEQLVCQVTPKDAKSLSRTLKTTSFILKIVVKLCEQFGNGNGCLLDCHLQLYQLLLTLQRFSPFVLGLSDVDKSLICEIERHLIVAADPLLSHILCEEGFQEEFCKGSFRLKSESEDRLPHLLLVLCIMRKLGPMNADGRARWLCDSKQNNIIGCLFEILKFSHSALGCEVWLPATLKSGQIPRNWDLYEALCCHCSALVLSCNADQFQVVESILMDSLLEPYYWSAFLSGDVWCVCARAGSSELVLDQVMYFADIVSSLECTDLSDKMECKVISLLFRRMCSFLSSKGKQILMERYPPSNHPLMCFIISIANFPKESRDSISRELIGNAVLSVDNFLKSSCEVSIFKKLILNLYGLFAALEWTSLKPAGDCGLKTILSKVVSLWQHSCRGGFSNNLFASNYFPSGSKWLSLLLYILSLCTANLVVFMNNQEICQVLNQLNSIIKCCDLSVKIAVIEILHSLATKPFEGSGQNFICGKISSLFSVLLEDENPLIQETALETFEYFAHFTAYESIVAEAVAKSVNLQVIVTAYLQKELPAVKAEHTLLSPRDYLLFQNNVPCEHKCTVKKPCTPPSESPENPSKKMKLECNDSLDLSSFLADDLLTEFVDQSIMDAVNRIIESVKCITGQSTFHLLPISSQEELRKAAVGLSSFVKI